MHVDEISWRTLRSGLDKQYVFGGPKTASPVRGAAQSCVLVDFKVKDAGSPVQVLSMIEQSDTCEIALRRLASWIHEKRTGDMDAAQSMLAVKPSSFASDIAPSWLVTEASTYSQSEHKCKERARAQWTESTKGKGKKGKDKGKRGTSGKGPESPQS